MNTLAKMLNMNKILPMSSWCNSNNTLSKSFHQLHKSNWWTTIKMMKTKEKMKCRQLIRKFKRVSKPMMKITIKLRRKEPSTQLKSEILKCREFFNKLLLPMLPNKLINILSSNRWNKKRDISKWQVVLVS